MEKTIHKLCDERELKSIVEKLAREIASAPRTKDKLRLIGVRKRGVFLAQRIATLLEEELDKKVPVGAVDITLYRDDLDETPRWPVLHGTDIPFNVDDAEIVLVDDVLYTGRTIRAAINAICDLGRPARIRLAIAVDRKHRELPIAPDFVGTVVGRPDEGPVHVKVKEVDGVDEVVQIVKNKPSTGRVKA